jgi:hypothetical protein
VTRLNPARSTSLILTGHLLTRDWLRLESAEEARFTESSSSGGLCGDGNQDATPPRRLHGTPAHARPKESDCTKPAAMAILNQGYFTLEQGRYGPIFPKTPACHGFFRGREGQTWERASSSRLRESIEEAVKNDPSVLAPLKLHYLRWILFDVGPGLHFMYQGSSIPILTSTSETRCAVRQNWHHDRICEP